jgi:hypothetical protein
MALGLFLGTAPTIYTTELLPSDLMAGEPAKLQDDTFSVPNVPLSPDRLRSVSAVQSSIGDSDNYDPKYTWYDNANWHIETVDSEGWSGRIPFAGAG